MIRSLWTAASGMHAQQLNVDTIANNLANVNTTGYRKARVSFQDLFYETLRGAGASPVGPLQVGHGVRPGAGQRSFTQGATEPTGNPLDLAIEGEGFFCVTLGDETMYTRDGNFRIDGEGYLVTTDGFKVQDDGGSEIQLPEDAQDVSISADGIITVRGADGSIQQVGQLKMSWFVNPAGLESVGHNLFRQTEACGEIREGTPANEGMGRICQGYLERANVSVVEEMVSLIVAQRAYELNSKVVQSSDEMLGIANNIRR
ncbi:MAG: flagellar basal-body rod protein FlgG [Firmicutes bacterium]|nr:flagellar basal-body rod protein FlgG [Bacillota bacterium]